MTQSTDGRSDHTAASGNEDGSHSPATAPMREDHDQLHEKEKGTRNRQEALLDEAVEETFPASDPVSPKRIT